MYLFDYIIIIIFPSFDMFWLWNSDYLLALSGAGNSSLPWMGVEKNLSIFLLMFHLKIYWYGLNWYNAILEKFHGFSLKRLYAFIWLWLRYWFIQRRMTSVLILVEINLCNCLKTMLYNYSVYDYKHNYLGSSV